jgi:seryl-tRNA synthetase
VLDIRLIRRDPDGVRAMLARRGAQAAATLDRVLELDERWRTLTGELEDVRAEQNRASRGRKGVPSEEERARLSELAARRRELGDEEAAVRAAREAGLYSLPNLPAADTPDEEQVVREVGAAGATGLDHLELAGERIDMARAAWLSGSRFAYLRGELVALELALISYAVAKLATKGFEPVIPPVLVRERALYGTGFLPDTEQQIYTVPGDDLYLTGTSEVALAALHQEEILSAHDLPLRYAGFSSCFRREAGAAGKDTRGIFRLHQFDKVEMFTFVEPETSDAEHEWLVGIQEEICRELSLPYRVVAIGVDDLGASAAKKYDVEAWLPGQGRYRELTSCSNTTNYQARRLGIRYRESADSRPIHVHTLNGTAVTNSRTIIALLENGQRDDGSVVLPAVLHGYGAPEVLAPARAQGK